MSQEGFEGFDDPNYGGSKYENWSLKEDSTAMYRILPAMKSLRKKKDYTQFWYTHFWKGQNPKSPEKSRSIPILCIQEKDFQRGGMVTKECPLCKKRETVKNRIKSIEAQGAAKGASKTQIAKVCQPHNVWLKDHGHDGKYRVYALNKAGQLGVLRLTSTCMKKLRDKTKKLVQDGYSPMSLQKGVWWQFTRSGKGFNTEDEVEVARIDRGDGSSVMDFHAISNEIAQAALETLPDFDEEQKRIAYPEEVLEALAACNDDPAEVNRILGIGVEEASDEGGFELDDEPAPTTTKKAAGPAVELEDDEFGEEPAAAAAAPEADDEEARLEAQLAASRAKKAAAAAAAAAAPKATAPAPAAKAVAKSTPAPAAAALDPSTATDEDFDNIFSQP